MRRSPSSTRVAKIMQYLCYIRYDISTQGKPRATASVPSCYCNLEQLCLMSSKCKRAPPHTQVMVISNRSWCASESTLRYTLMVTTVFNGPQSGLGPENLRSLNLK
ncbi:hypothetical protein EVAR_56210_1 [Eumeta japonica]|uniref:Uncharacterized protein n=1 Tax=Eumeta variegata TaxID=151549 RepID=A0A4C1Y485_EUMVA|nr:hypothetical protein EVAR_56210_1 [Eumeta japonica]